MLAVLDGLVVRGRAPSTGYSRAAFGPAWADVDRNGCDTRNDVLARDLTGVRFRDGTRNCVVIAGELDDPYTGARLSFVKADAAAVQIDHVVALSDAWQKGAAGWTDEQRLAFANDPLELLAVGGAANQAKGDGDAATWLPPAQAYRCTYVARQIAVKHAYALSVTAAEHDAMQRILTSCPGQVAATPAGTTATPSSTLPSTPASSETLVPGAADPDYGSCSNAEANGAGPYRVGQPEYDYYRDADGDGVVCER